MTIEEPEVTTINEKRQVVIPQSIRKELGIKPKNKFWVYGRGDTIIMKKLELPSLKQEWDDIFKLMNKEALKISDEEIQEEVAAGRKKNRWSNVSSRPWHKRSSKRNNLTENQENY